jgi:epoxyqueuosine reductase
MPGFAETALKDGFYLRTVPVARLKDLRADIEAFQNAEELNRFQQWILSRYIYEAPPLPFEVRSVIVAVNRCHSFAEVTFHQNGRAYLVYSPTPLDTSAGDTETYIKNALEQGGYHMAAVEGWLPIKRFAVQSSLAEYGKNNITYVPGLGSYVSYSVYFSDVEPDADEWRPVVTAKACDGCVSCREHCPTGAIRPDRFLIDNLYCLSAFNEDGGDEFEPFVPKDIHHTTINCLRCQYSCPMNAEANKNTAPAVSFDEAETALLLGEDPYDQLPEALRQKCAPLGFDGIPGLKRNLRACFAIVDNGGQCSLI